MGLEIVKFNANILIQFTCIYEESMGLHRTAQPDLLASNSGRKACLLTGRNLVQDPCHGRRREEDRSHTAFSTTIHVDKS